MVFYSIRKNEETNVNFPVDAAGGQNFAHEINFGTRTGTNTFRGKGSMLWYGKIHTRFTQEST